MALFAHVSNNEVLDPRQAADLDAYKASFGGAAETAFADHTFKEVPAGTLHGARDNGDGTYTPPPEPPKDFKVLSKTAFQDYAVTQLGGGLTGMARFTAIMDATRDSASGAVRFAFARYEVASTFERENTSQLTAVMAADNTDGHLTEQERSAILDNWP